MKSKSPIMIVIKIATLKMSDKIIKMVFHNLREKIKMSDGEYINNYDSDKNSDADNESQDYQNSFPQSSRK